jgi:bifunctional non-homologous end joining protein LigD
MGGQERMDVVASLPRIEPIIPTFAPPAHRAGWVYEEKVDGWRIVAYKDGAHVRLIGRRGVDHRGRFPDLAAAIAALPATNLIVDGEVAIFDDQLVSRFHLLWERAPDVPSTPPLFMAFDCLYLNGLDLRARPLHERRRTLEEQIRDQRLVLPVRRLAADGLQAWAEVQRRGYEGLVAKEESAAYRRSTRWLKSKLRQDGRFVIGGMAMARAGHQGGVLVGEWEGDRLLYRGFVDLGLSRGALDALRTDAQPLARPASPFEDLQRRKDTVWLEPVLEADVSYGRIVGGQLRDPVLRRFVTERAHASPAQRPSRRRGSSSS